jgi:DNA-binding CsgD family transcriptional regulator
MESIAGLLDADAPAPWRPALRGMVDLLGADHAMIAVHDTANGQSLLLEGAGMGDGDLSRFASPEAARWMEPFARALPQAKVTKWSELVSDRQFERSAFYNEVVRPANGFYALAARQELGTASVFLAVCRSKESHDFETGDTASLQAVLPLFAASLDLQRRLRLTELRCSSLEQTLDRLATGVILLDAMARPVFVNAPAQVIAAAKDGLTLSASGLAADGPQQSKSLQRAITLALAAKSGGAITRLCLSRPLRRSPLVVNVVPIHRRKPSGRPADTAQAALFLVDPESPPAIDADLLVAAFGFAPREAELAALVAGGAKLADAAARLGIGVGTARWYLKRVLEKTGTHHQAQLIHLILHGFGSRTG